MCRNIQLNGVSIQFKSYEQGREKFQGAGVRLIWFDEEPPQDIWDECFVRVEAGQQLDVILTMTAIKGMTWVYNRIYQDTSNPDLYVSTAGWDDNPFLTEAQKDQMARGLTPAALKVRREGKFTKRVGLVCHWFDRSKHIRHYDSYDRSWTWYEVLDGGWSDPACWLLVGVDKDNDIHVVNGYRRQHMKDADMKRERDTKLGGITITQGWIDNNDPRLQQQLADLKDENDNATPWLLDAVTKVPNETKSWDETLAAKLEEYGAIQAGTGEPRLYISDNLIQFNELTGVEENWLMQEIENLVWQERVSKAGEETLPSWDDHRRYGHHFDGIRSLSYLLVSYMKQSTKAQFKKPAAMLARKRAHRISV
jgi:phage terminase large subunit-like protein